MHMCKQQQGAGGDTFIGPLTLAAALRACTGQRHNAVLVCGIALAWMSGASTIMDVALAFPALKWFAKRLTLW